MRKHKRSVIIVKKAWFALLAALLLAALGVTGICETLYVDNR